MTISNTIFKYHPRRLSTWTSRRLSTCISPSGRYKNEIDYILLRTRWWTAITNTGARPGAICGSDHKLQKPSLTIKLMTLTLCKPSQRLPIPEEGPFQEILRISVPALTEGDQTWKTIKIWIISGVNKTTNPKSIKKKYWIKNNRSNRWPEKINPGQNHYPGE